MFYVAENRNLMGFPVRTNGAISRQVRELISLFVPECLESEICGKIELENLCIDQRQFISRGFLPD